MNWGDELQAVLDAWAGTRYMPGQSCRGRVADCIGFVAGVLDELHGYEDPPPVPRHANDVAFHNPRLAAQVTLGISRRWPMRAVRRGWEPEAGDVLLVRVGSLGTGGHAMLVGARPREAWHCDFESGVCYTGVEAVRPLLVRAWRPTEKETWRRRS